MFKKIIPFIGFAVIVFIFFWQFFLKGLLPIPSDTVVGLYHPYRDLIATEYPNGYPFKNFLITDPVRQQIPWKTFSIASVQSGQIPSWNPYNFSGTPNLANFQSGVYYPLNLIFFISDYKIAWSIFILLQPFLVLVFTYLYLRNLNLDEYSSYLGAIIFAFSGFFSMWLSWGNILHTALWLPLILLSIDKIYRVKKLNKRNVIWSIILFVSLIFAIFAGHLQTLFYLLIFSSVYFLARLYQSSKRIRFIFLVGIPAGIAFVIGLIQILPTLQFIELSARSFDLARPWEKEGWFIPLNQLIQLIAPDFFGNPTTLNYWGVWNYGEMTAYMGIGAIILALLAILFRRDKKTIFFFSAAVVSLIFATSNIFSKLPFILDIPLISTSQPTRLIFILNFSLAVLSALGLNFLIIKGKLRQVLIPIVVIGVIFLILFIFTKFSGGDVNVVNLQVSNRNLYFPGIIFVLSSILILLIIKVPQRFKWIVLFCFLFITIFDLFRFSWKFNTFSKSEFLYPETASIKFLKNNLGEYRYATSDSRILAPNFNMMHNLYSVEGYDPLYLNKYGEFIAAINRGKPDIDPPYGFNRIVRVENFDSDLINLLGIKYILSLDEINKQNFELVEEDGQTKVYENKNVLPRVFFVENVEKVEDREKLISKLFNNEFNPLETAFVEKNINKKYSVGRASIVSYTPNEIIIESENDGEGFLVLTDAFYPTWHAKINGKDVEIFETDYLFRGVEVPEGKSIIVFKNNLL